MYLCTAFAKDRNVAQLVAHYVRDVGVGRSSRLIPTKERKLIQVSFRSFLFFYFCKHQPMIAL